MTLERPSFRPHSHARDLALLRASLVATWLATAIASAQSTSGTPPGAHTVAGRCLSAYFLLPANTRKIRPSTKARCTPRCVVSRSRPKPAV